MLRVLRHLGNRVARDGGSSMSVRFIISVPLLVVSVWGVVSGSTWAASTDTEDAMWTAARAVEESVLLESVTIDGQLTRVNYSLPSGTATAWLEAAHSFAGDHVYSPSSDADVVQTAGPADQLRRSGPYPDVAAFVRLADRGRVRVRITNATMVDHEGAISHDPTGLAASGEAGPGSGGTGTPVQAGEPVILRDLRLLPLTIVPVAFDSAGTIRGVYTELTVEVECDGVAGVNEKVRPARARSRPFASLYGSLLPEHVSPLEGSGEPGAYLFIVPDSEYDRILPLVEWKRLVGHDTAVALTSQIGPSEYQIRTYIQWAYDNWDPPPTYVVLVGDIDGDIAVPTWTYQADAETDVTDLPYGLLEGDDYFPEVMVGRLSVRTSSQLETIVAKILSYERDPHVADPGWFERALMIADTTSISCLWTKEWVKNLMLDHGYSEIDTVWYSWYINPSPVFSSINQGVGFVNYRGFAYWGGFSNGYVYALSNGHRLPVVTDIVCEGGDYEWPECFGEAWIRAGSALVPRGAVTYIGTSELYTHTRFNNCLDTGIYHGIFEEGLATPGLALLRGKLELYNDFPHNRGSGGPDNSVECYFHTYNILGDPGLAMWTAAPQAMTVDHPERIPVGTNLIEVTVHDSSTALPIEDALVSLVGSEAAHGWTDGSGSARLIVDIQVPDSIAVTVTKANSRPYTGHLLAESDALCLGYWAHSIDDDTLGASQGNGDGVINPGERIELAVQIRNFGLDSTAVDPRSLLHSTDPYVAVIDSIELFGDIPPGDIAVPLAPFVVDVSPLSPHDHCAQLELQMSAASGDTWDAGFDLLLGAPRLTYAGRVIDDGDDGVLDPGESASLVISVANSGPLGITSVHGSLESSHTGIDILGGEALFGDIAANGGGGNGEDPFFLSAAPEIPRGTKVDFSLVLSGVLPNAHRYRQIVDFSLHVGAAGEDDPLGPDIYGYYAFDSGDTVRYAEAPRFEWIEIDPAYGGGGSMLNIDDYGYQLDATAVLDLPFTFRYYGEDYDCISVCSNGWIAMDTTWMTGFRNWPIGAPLCPKGVVAPFWDDLFIPSPDSSGIFYYHDAAGKRFIVEWSRVRIIVQSWAHPFRQTFQVILHDPAYTSTPTGDGEIVFQYRNVLNADNYDNYATVGILSPSGTDGLEYTYSSLYPPQAGALHDGLAIKWTTELGEVIPTEVEGEPDVELTAPPSWALSQSYPNPFFAFRGPATITYGLPRDAAVELAVYNVMGQLVRTLVAEDQSAGVYTVTWDGRDAQGGRVASGVYFYSLVTPQEDLVRKIVLIN